MSVCPRRAQRIGRRSLLAAVARHRSRFPCFSTGIPVRTGFHGELGSILRAKLLPSTYCVRARRTSVRVGRSCSWEERKRVWNVVGVGALQRGTRFPYPVSMHDYVRFHWSRGSLADPFSSDSSNPSEDSPTRFGWRHGFRLTAQWWQRPDGTALGSCNGTAYRAAKFTPIAGIAPVPWVDKSVRSLVRAGFSLSAGALKHPTDRCLRSQVPGPLITEHPSQLRASPMRLLNFSYTTAQGPG